MSTSPGPVERLSLTLARMIRNNGGHPDVSVGTMRYALQLWISILMIFAVTAACSALLGTVSEALASLLVIGVLRYFSGGWHFRSMELCIVFTVAVASSIPLLPAINDTILLLMNGVSLLLVLMLAPTGHGQQFSSLKHRSVFRWLAVFVVALNFLPLSQEIILSILIQSLTLITRERR